MAETQWQGDFFEGFAGRRKKAAFLLFTIWTIVITLHLANWGHWVILALTCLISWQFVRMLTSEVEVHSYKKPITEYPIVSLLVAAKNEEAVVSNLVNQLCNLDYPADRYEVWIIDDNKIGRAHV